MVSDADQKSAHPDRRARQTVALCSAPDRHAPAPKTTQQPSSTDNARSKTNAACNFDHEKQCALRLRSSQRLPLFERVSRAWTSGAGPAAAILTLFAPNICGHGLAAHTLQSW